MSAPPSGAPQPPRRTNVYIDSWNLYFGCLKGTPYRWINVAEMVNPLPADARFVEMYKTEEKRPPPTSYRGHQPGSHRPQDDEQARHCGHLLRAPATSSRAPSSSPSSSPSARATTIT